MAQPLVGLIMGSLSDREIMKGGEEILKRFGVPYEIEILSAHRTPQEAARYAETARERGLQIIIAGAGWAAHLAGAVASRTTLPVIGVPIDSSPLAGFDSLLATVQMPKGVPVATVSIGKGGAENAALLAVEILSLGNENLASLLEKHRAGMKEKVLAETAKLKAR